MDELRNILKKEKVRRRCDPYQVMEKMVRESGNSMAKMSIEKLEILDLESRRCQ